MQAVVDDMKSMREDIVWPLKWMCYKRQMSYLKETSLRLMTSLSEGLYTTEKTETISRLSPQ